MRRVLIGVGGAAVSVVLAAAPAGACGGLIGPRGSVSLVRTTTLAAYHDGVEHYVTAFKFLGGGGAFGSIVPLPGVPSDVSRGGDWTLQRLVRETQPREADGAAGGAAFATAAAAPAQVLLEKQVDALDVTVLKGGATAVGDWARGHGFLLPPDSPQVLDFYARRSPIFLAARFDAAAAQARGQQLGDGTPLHITIPTPDPWVPLRILGLGREPAERVQADIFLLGDVRPALLPAPNDDGFQLRRSEPASPLLLDDLRRDQGMGWVPQSMWLSYLRLDTPAGHLTYDLAIDGHGTGHPSPVAAGLANAASVVRASRRHLLLPLVGAALALLVGTAGVARLRTA